MSIETNFCLCCIDKRFDYLATAYLNSQNNKNEFYLCSTAGSSLSLGYKCYCKNICNNCNNYNKCNKCSNSQNCNPCNSDIKILKESVTKNIDISLSLDNIKSIYMINHQDCGAIKAYLKCSGYPQTLGENNQKDIEVNTQLLLFSKKYINCKYPNINSRLGLIDINGTIAEYINKKWVVVYTGEGTNPLGLWWNY